jgi:hypothetical protein
MLKDLKEKDLQQILRSKNLRQRLAHEDPLWFALIYLWHHFEHAFAPFQAEMFHLIRQPKHEFIVIMAFRESGKSTIMNMANILWSILGKPQKRFAVIVSRTQEQAKNHFNNIKEELLGNELLREDFGPFTEDESDWKKMSLELDYRDSRILSVSQEQSIRGIKHKSIRPDLIVCDDLEDSSARFEPAKRDELYGRFVSEILPLGNQKTRIVVLGNLICEDSLLMRLKNEIDQQKQRGLFRAYPIIDNDRRILWPDKFANLEKIKQLWKKFPKGVWRREFLLKLAGGDDDSELGIMLLPERDGGENERPDTQIDPPRQRSVTPRQRALIPPMKKFHISPPEKISGVIIYSSEHEKFECLRLFDNLYLDEPMMDPPEKLEREVQEPEQASRKDAPGETA